MCSEDEVRQLRRFKQDIEENSFYNSQENYQLALLCGTDLEDYNKQMNLPLEQLLELLQVHHTSIESIEAPSAHEEEAVHMGIPSLEMPGEMVIPELSLGLELGGMQ